MKLGWTWVGFFNTEDTESTETEDELGLDFNHERHEKHETEPQPDWDFYPQIMQIDAD